MVNRRDNYVGFQGTEAALDVREALDGLSGGEVGGIADKRELAVVDFGLDYSVVVDASVHPISIQIGLNEQGELGFCDGADEAALGPTVRGMPALGGLF